MDLTTATLQELRQRKAEIEDILLSGQAENIGALTDERNMISNKIAELAENEPDEEIEEKDPVIEMAMEEIGLFGTPLGAYISGEVAHISVRKAILPYIYSLIEELETTKAAKEINEVNANNEQSELLRQIEEQAAEITALKTSKYEAELLAADRATKIDNAYNELQEARETIEQLNEKLTSANTVKPTYRTNVDGPAAVEAKRKREIYDVEYLGTNGNRFKAKYADTDESFEDYTVYKAAKFTEVTAEEATTFRTEYLATQEPVETSSGGTVAVEEQPVEVAPFQEETSAGLELAPEASAVVGSTVTREEFAALSERVAAIEKETIGKYNF